MKNHPFLYALGAAVYIIIVAFVMNTMSKLVPGADNQTILGPISFLSLFVLSTAVMGFLFLSRPVLLYFGGYREDAVSFFLKTVGSFAVFVVIFFAALLLLLRDTSLSIGGQKAESKTVTFVCSNAKTITATFYPKDDAFVDLKLSDGRNMSVPRAISASGARYATADESFVFWNKGDTAFVTEGATSSVETYSGCELQ